MKKKVITVSVAVTGAAVIIIVILLLLNIFGKTGNFTEYSAVLAETGSDGAYSIDIDESMISVSEGSGYVRYYYGDDIFLELRYIAGESPEDEEPSFMDDYIEYLSIEYTGTSCFRETDIEGLVITAYNDTEVAEACLTEDFEGIFAIVLCYPANSSKKRLEYMDKILKTLKLY